jgi:hypothetical protein
MADDEHGVVGANDQQRGAQKMKLAIFVVQNGGTRRTGQNELTGPTRDVWIKKARR